MRTTLTLEEMKFNNDSVFQETIQTLVKTHTLSNLVRDLFHAFPSWDVRPEFTRKQLKTHLKTEWKKAGGRIGV
jgi:hypothetical protein